MADQFPPFHPMTVLRDWKSVSPGAAFRLADAYTGVVCFGGTGSGKTSGPAKHLANAYAYRGFGGLVLCAKPEEREQWTQWAVENGRADDLVIFDTSGRYRFNFLDWEASRAGGGGGLTLNIVALLDEIAGAIAGEAAKGGDSGGDSKFFDDALHHMNTNLVDLVLFAGLPVSLPLLRAILNTAPQSGKQASSDEWQQGNGECAAMLRVAEERTVGDDEVREDFEECRAYWLQEYPNLSEKTRSIITLSFSMLVRPFITRPLRRLFSTQTNIRPEDAFDGKIIIVDLPLQEFRLAGRVAALAWKYCFQIAVLRRVQPQDGTYLRPVFLWWDEGHNFVTDFDAVWHSVARSAGGCSVLLVQTREALRSVLGNDDRVEALLANLQCKFFCQNSSPDTNEYASKLLGQRWVEILNTTTGGGAPGDQTAGPTGSVSASEALRHYVEPAEFAKLRRGGAKNDFSVDCIVYNGGAQYLHQQPADRMPDVNRPYAFITFKQK